MDGCMDEGRVADVTPENEDEGEIVSDLLLCWMYKQLCFDLTVDCVRVQSCLNEETKQTANRSQIIKSAKL